jgi:hypothetical protein
MKDWQNIGYSQSAWSSSESPDQAWTYESPDGLVHCSVWLWPDGRKTVRYSPTRGQYTAFETEEEARQACFEGKE